MIGIDERRTEMKKLTARAMQAKLDLHDLSEELPTNWQQILAVAQRTHDAFAALERAREAESKQPETTS